MNFVVSFQQSDAETLEPQVERLVALTASSKSTTWSEWEASTSSCRAVVTPSLHLSTLSPSSMAFIARSSHDVQPSSFFAWCNAHTRNAATELNRSGAIAAAAGWESQTAPENCGVYRQHAPTRSPVLSKQTLDATG